MKGNWGKILKVNLTEGKTETVELEEKLYRDYLGGSGLAAKWFFDHKCWNADPLSPENPLMFMLGPLSGSNLPGSLQILTTIPFADNSLNAVKGDYANITLALDLNVQDILTNLLGAPGLPSADAIFKLLQNPPVTTTGAVPSTATAAALGATANKLLDPGTTTLPNLTTGTGGN